MNSSEKETNSSENEFLKRHSSLLMKSEFICNTPINTERRRMLCKQEMWLREREKRTILEKDCCDFSLTRPGTEQYKPMTIQCILV